MQVLGVGTEEDLGISKCENSFWNLADAAKLCFSDEVCVCVHVEGALPGGQSGRCYRSYRALGGICWGRNNPNSLAPTVELRAGPGVLWDVQGGADPPGYLLLHLFLAPWLAG